MQACPLNTGFLLASGQPLLAPRHTLPATSPTWWVPCTHGEVQVSPQPNTSFPKKSLRAEIPQILGAGHWSASKGNKGQPSPLSPHVGHGSHLTKADLFGPSTSDTLPHPVSLGPQPLIPQCALMKTHSKLSTQLSLWGTKSFWVSTIIPMSNQAVLPMRFGDGASATPSLTSMGTAIPLQLVITTPQVAQSTQSGFLLGCK